MTTKPTLIRIADILTDKLGRHLASATSAELEAAARAVVENVAEWQPIETAPKDGTCLDLWVRSCEDGSDADDVSFYCNHMDRFNKKTRRREGMVRDMVWTKYGPNKGWYAVGGLRGPAMSVEAVLWRHRPAPPQPDEAGG